jgi:hypothetical protein
VYITGLQPSHPQSQTLKVAIQYICQPQLRGTFARLTLTHYYYYNYRPDKHAAGTCPWIHNGQICFVASFNARIYQNHSSRNHPASRCREHLRL